jgi:hypothetical protein
LLTTKKALWWKACGTIIVESGPDVLVDRLEFDEHQGQAVDEADQIGAGVVVGHPQALKFELADGEEAVVGLAVRSLAIAEIDDAGVGMARFTRSIPPFDGHAVPDEAVELPVVLQ